MKKYYLFLIAFITLVFTSMLSAAEVETTAKSLITSIGKSTDSLAIINCTISMETIEVHKTTANIYAASYDLFIVKQKSINHSTSYRKNLVVTKTLVYAPFEVGWLTNKIYS